MAVSIPSRELQEGDIIVFLGQPHLVTELEPYRHPILGDGLIAHSSNDWTYAVYPGDAVTVERVAK